jgi:hypothetical protein
VSKSKPVKYIHITDGDFNLGSDLKDFKIQSQGSWQNEMTWKELDAELNDAREDCNQPLGEQYFLKRRSQWPTKHT